MSARTAAEVYIQPKGRRPLQKTAPVNYSTPAELRRQIEAYAATVWISAKKIIVDPHAKEIIVDSVPVANYHVHIAGQPAPETPPVPTTPQRPRPRAAARRYMRETAAQAAVVALGLALVLAAAGTLNGLFLAGLALAAFGIYRMALGVQRREAATRHGRRDIRTVADLPGRDALAA